METILNILGLVITWGIWIWLASRKFDPVIDLFIAVGGVLAILPVIFLGRKELRAQPTIKRAERLTTVVHYLIAILLGSAIVSAARFALQMPTWLLPIPAWLGITLMLIGGLALVLAIFNLVIKGLGAPFAIALTRMVVTDWMYAWTRNPMVLSALAFLVGLGLWLQSGLFLLWLLAVVSPAVVVYLKFYEEAELEIRFGREYREYKARTPRLLPRKPSG